MGNACCDEIFKPISRFCTTSAAPITSSRFPADIESLRGVRKLFKRILGRANPCFFDKNLNGQIAEGMGRGDIQGTDLEAILDDIEFTAKTNLGLAVLP